MIRLTPRWPRLALAFAASLIFVSGVRGERRVWDASPAAVEKRLFADVKHLASDELEGRGLKTKGLVIASESIADAFKEAGLDTTAVGGTPFFIFNTRTTTTVDEKTSISMKSGESSATAWRLDQDFRPLSLGRAGAVDFPLAFAGYSITDEKSGYDDYENFDVKGKAVVVLRREPRQKDPESPFNGTKNSDHAYLVRKVQNAANHGASMMILVNDALSIDVDKKPDDLAPFDVKARFNTRPIPVIHVTRDALAPLFGKNGLAELESQIDADLKPKSRHLDGWTISGQVLLQRKGNGLRNVIGVLEPDGPFDETIIVGAHYDHLGRGDSGSLAPWTRDIHNGADDNGSGTAVMMEVARQVAMRRGEIKRRVVFMAFSAEEAGLIGSQRYVRSPVYPIDETAAMVNLDMVGRLGKKLIVYGTGTGNGFEGMVDRHAKSYELDLKKIAGGSGPSDHASFHRVGVPVLHLFTGLHSDYHRPSDDYDKLNIQGMRRITAMTVDIVMQLASSTEPTRKPRKTLFGADAPAKGSTTLGVGIVPVENGKGVKVTAVKDGGPAKAAGIRVDDVLLTVNGDELESVEQLRKEVTRRKADDKIKLKIRRGEIMLEVEAVLQKAM